MRKRMEFAGGVAMDVHGMSQKEIKDLQAFYQKVHDNRAKEQTAFKDFAQEQRRIKAFGFKNDGITDAQKLELLLKAYPNIRIHGIAAKDIMLMSSGGIVSGMNVALTNGGLSAVQYVRPDDMDKYNDLRVNQGYRVNSYWG